MILASLLATYALIDSKGLDSAYGVLQRTIGRQSRDFQLTLTEKRPDGLDEFTVSAQDGKVTIRGTSPVALTRAAYEYLRTACHIQVNWSESNLTMPKQLPDYAERHVVCPNRYRHYFNICTFGYSAVWWDWKRWQHEIDWMALHGVNFPLALNGQEKIWQKVFRSYGLPDASIDKFFSGPAFLPWHWMGNLNEHGGPMPQSWIDGQAALQKKILASERGLGMTPVVSGFSGFVPVDFSKYHPEVKLSSPTAWCGFEPTTFVDVRNPIFVQIGKRYVEEYKKEFGSDHYYLCDTFNEQNPQFPKETELSDLAACGKSVYESIHQADPEGTWVMQGWLFRNAPDYWTVPKADALVREVPKGKMIILDLDTADAPVWTRLPAVRDGGYIYNTLHNYGQNTTLYGDLQHYADRAFEDLTNPDHGKMLGMGMTMEGIDQNPVLYELLTDLMWTDQRLGANKIGAPWLDGYIRSRYEGIKAVETDGAWNALLQTVYGNHSNSETAAWRLRPSLGRVGQPANDPAKLRDATRHLKPLLSGQEGNRLLQRDVVDVTKTWLSAIADARLAAAVATYDSDHAAYLTHKAKFFEALKDLDRVMAVMPEHRLSTWISDARKWGTTPAEKDQMEWNARMQVTIWGRLELFDYANKEWAGLNQDFIVERWRLFFDALEKGHTTADLKLPDFPAWEKKWTESRQPIAESKPERLVSLVQGLLDKYGEHEANLTELLHLNADPGIAVGAKVWDSGHTEGSHAPELAVDGNLTGGYWSASPAPQWIEVDLGASKTVGGAWLFPYYGDGRYYQYKIETSEDNQTWRTAVDASANETPSTFHGYRHAWTPSNARYIRVTMLHNSANVGVHLYELRIYGATVPK